MHLNEIPIAETEDAHTVAIAKTGPAGCVSTDIDSFDVVIEDNVVERNFRSGVLFEVSDTALIRGNYSEGNGLDDTRADDWAWSSGMLVASSGNAEIYNNVVNHPSAENNAALQAEINHRMKIDTFFKDLYPQHIDSVPVLPTDFTCYRKLIETYEEHCEAITDYTMKYFRLFVAECEGMKSVPDALGASVQKLEDACKPADKEDLLDFTGIHARIVKTLLTGFERVGDQRHDPLLILFPLNRSIEVASAPLHIRRNKGQIDLGDLSRRQLVLGSL